MGSWAGNGNDGGQGRKGCVLKQLDAKTNDLSPTMRRWWLACKIETDGTVQSPATRHTSTLDGGGLPPQRALPHAPTPHLVPVRPRVAVAVKENQGARRLDRPTSLALKIVNCSNASYEAQNQRTPAVGVQGVIQALGNNSPSIVGF